MGTSEIATRPLHASARSKRAISERAQEHAPPFRAGVLDRRAYALIFAPTPAKSQDLNKNLPDAAGMRWLMLFMASVLLLGCAQPPTGQVSRDGLADAIRADPVIGQLVAQGYLMDIQVYSGSALADRGRQYPVIYGSLDGEIAAVQLSKDASGKLFIYDMQRKEILREFTTQGVTVS